MSSLRGSRQGVIYLLENKKKGEKETDGRRRRKKDLIVYLFQV